MERPLSSLALWALFLAAVGCRGAPPLALDRDLERGHRVGAAARRDAPRSARAGAPAFDAAPAPGRLARAPEAPAHVLATHAVPIPPGSAPAAFLDVGERWGFAMATGADWLEEGIPSYDFHGYDVGLRDTFLSVSWLYGVTGSSFLVGTLAAVRPQDESITGALDATEFVWAMLGVHLLF